MLQDDDLSVFEGMVIERRSTDRNSLQRVDCGVVEKASDWRVFRLSLLPMEVGTGQLHEVDPGCVTRLKTFVGKVVHLCRVYKTCHDTPCSGKELRSQRGKGLHEVLTTREG